MSVSEPPQDLPPLPPPRSGATTVVIATIIVLLAFAAGIIAGVAGDRLLIHRGYMVGPPPIAVKAIVHHLDRELRLTPQQHTQIEAIIGRGHTRITAVWSSVHPRIHAEIERTNAEIEKILTPEQRRKFATMKMRFGPHVERRMAPPAASE